MTALARMLLKLWWQLQAYKLSHPTWMGPKAVKERHA